MQFPCFSPFINNCVVKIHQGGGVAAPIASQVLGEVLPYLEISKDNENEENIKEKIEMPRIIGMTVKEAEKVLKEYELNLQINTEQEIDKEQAIIKEQVPTNGIEVYKGSNISVKIE